MADKIPIRGGFNGGSLTGLAQFASGDTLGVAHGGTGIVTIGSNQLVTGNGTSAITSESDLTFNGTTLATTAFTATGNVSLDGGTFVFNDSGADKDFRIEGDTDTELFIADASTNRIGIGTLSPTHLLDVNGVANVSTCIVTPKLCIPDAGMETTGYVLPAGDGSAGQLMCTDGNGALAFATASGGVTLAGSTNNTIATVTGADALCGEANLTFDGTTMNVVGNAGVGIARTEGTLHVHTASAGAVTANTGYDDLVVEGSGGAGVSVITADAQNAGIALGGVTDSLRSLIYSTHNSGSPFLAFYHNAAERMRIDSSGNVGVKTVPNAAWTASQAVIQLGTMGVWTNSHDETATNSLAMVSNNMYYDSAGEWRYIVTDEATRYYQNAGGHYFDTAPSGSAGAAASFNNKLHIAQAGAITTQAGFIWEYAGSDVIGSSFQDIETTIHSKFNTVGKAYYLYYKSVADITGNYGTIQWGIIAVSGNEHTGGGSQRQTITVLHTNQSSTYADLSFQIGAGSTYYLQAQRSSASYQGWVSFYIAPWAGSTNVQA